jgi:hypothetical protein
MKGIYYKHHCAHFMLLWMTGVIICNRISGGSFLNMLHNNSLLLLFALFSVSEVKFSER